MIVDITAALVAYLAPNRGPDLSRAERLGPPDYGIAGTLAGDLVEVALTFRAPSTYCCMEPGCHLPLHEGKPWPRFHAELVAHGIVAPTRLRLSLTGIVEVGSRFFDPFRPDPDHPGEYALRAAQAQRYTHAAHEV